MEEFVTVVKKFEIPKEKEFIKSLCEEFEANPMRGLSPRANNIEHLNQLLCSFVYKICY